MPGYVNSRKPLSYDWSAFAGGEKGTAPYSELEAQVVREWLARNYGATISIDFHNTLESLNQVSYISTPNRQLDLLYTSLSRRLSAVWQNDYPSSAFGNFETDNAHWPTTVRESFHVAGIEISALIEIIKSDNGVNYTSAVIEESVDLLANFLLATLNFLNITGTYNAFNN